MEVWYQNISIAALTTVFAHLVQSYGFRLNQTLLQLNLMEHEVSRLLHVRSYWVGYSHMLYSPTGSSLDNLNVKVHLFIYIKKSHSCELSGGGCVHRRRQGGACRCFSTSKEAHSTPVAPPRNAQPKHFFQSSNKICSNRWHWWKKDSCPLEVLHDKLGEKLNVPEIFSISIVCSL